MNTTRRSFIKKSALVPAAIAAGGSLFVSNLVNANGEEGGSSGTSEWRRTDCSRKAGVSCTVVEIPRANPEEGSDYIRHCPCDDESNPCTLVCTHLIGSQDECYVGMIVEGDTLKISPCSPGPGIPHQPNGTNDWCQCWGTEDGNPCTGFPCYA